MKILALEASTSSAKAMIYDTDKGVIEVRSKAYDTEHCNVVSMDAEKVVEAVLALGAELTAVENRIDLITLSSIWYHSACFLDNNFIPLSRLLTWADTTAAETAARCRSDRKFADWVYQKTGNPPHSIYALYKWLYLKEKDVQMARKVHYIAGLPDFLFERLTGRCAVSNMTASASGMLNIHTLQWDEDILERAGLRKEQLSEVVEPEYFAPLGDSAAKKLGLPSGLPVMACGGDGALNQIATGGLQQGIMTLSVGTSAAMRLSCERPVLTEKHETWCYYGAEKKWISGAATSGAGSCVEWFVKRASYSPVDFSELNGKLAQRYDQPLEAPIFLPFLYGERCPGWNDERTGGFFEMKGNFDAVDLYYSILEGVLFNLYQCFKKLCTVSGMPERILVSGGIVRSPVWLQMTADMFGRPIELSTVEHASILGAVALGMKHLGCIHSVHKFQANVGDCIFPQRKGSFEGRFVRYLEWYEKTGF